MFRVYRVETLVQTKVIVIKCVFDVARLLDGHNFVPSKLEYHIRIVKQNEALLDSNASCGEQIHNILVA